MPRKGRSYPAELKAKVAVEGQRPALPAVRRPLAIPAAAAAADTVVPSILFSRNRRTCASGTNPSSRGKQAVSHAHFAAHQPATRIVVDPAK